MNDRLFARAHAPTTPATIHPRIPTITHLAEVLRKTRLDLQRGGVRVDARLAPQQKVLLLAVPRCSSGGGAFRLGGGCGSSSSSSSTGGAFGR
jgi:hypothetical protein